MYLGHHLREMEVEISAVSLENNSGTPSLISSPTIGAAYYPGDGLWKHHLYPPHASLTFFLLIIPVPALLMPFFSALVLPTVTELGIPALPYKRSASKIGHLVS